MTTQAPHSTIAVPAASRHRWRARVGFAVLTAAAAALFVTAGNWQRDRMHAKESLRERYDAAAAAQPVVLNGLRAPDDWSALRYQRVVAIGRFDASRQILIDNRVRAGQVGYDVVTPLVLDDGRRVLVDRGWIAQGATRSVLPEVPPPAGPVSVHGRINIAPRYFELSRASAQGVLWQHIDPLRFSASTGVAVLPIVIEQIAVAAPGDALLRDWPAPDLGVERHRIYMVQWYAFAALAVALWVLVTVRASRPRAGKSANG